MGAWSEAPWSGLIFVRHEDRRCRSIPFGDDPQPIFLARQKRRENPGASPQRLQVCGLVLVVELALLQADMEVEVVCGLLACLLDHFLGFWRHVTLAGWEEGVGHWL